MVRRVLQIIFRAILLETNPSHKNVVDENDLEKMLYLTFSNILHSDKPDLLHFSKDVSFFRNHLMFYFLFLQVNGDNLLWDNIW